MSTLRKTDRRAFLGRTALAAAALAAPAALRADGAPAPSAIPDDRWLDTLRGRHRQIFDMPQPAGGLPMLHVRNYLETYRAAYGLSHPDVNAVVGLYYMTVPLALDDAMWAKYQLGAASHVVDAGTGQPAVRNVLARPREGADVLPIAGGPVAPPNDVAIAELQRRGALFLLCNNAVGFWSGQLAAASKQQPAAVREELLSHLLPGVVVVPAMVIAFQQAQARGASYMFLP